MKKLFSKMLLLLSLVIVGVVMTACELDPTGSNAQPSLTIGEATVSINSVTVPISTTNIKQYAYLVQGAGLAAPKPVVIFKSGTVVDATDGTSSIELDDLEYGTHYTLFVAAKISGGYKEEVEQVSFTTENVTEDVTIIRYNYDGADIHIRFPEEVKKRGNKIKWMVSSIPDNKKWKPAPTGYFTDAELVQQNDNALPAFLIHGDTTLRIREENRVQIVGQDTIEYYPRITPGEPLIVSIQEVEYLTDDSNSGWGAGWYGSPFLYDEFMAAYGAASGGGAAQPWSTLSETRAATPSEEDFWPEDSWHKTLRFNAKDPEPLNATVNVSFTGYDGKPDNLNAKSGYINFNPEEGAYCYCVSILDNATYSTLVLKWGVPKNRMQWFATSFFAAYEGMARNFHYNAGPVKQDIYSWLGGNVIPGGKYHVLVTAMAGIDTKYGMEEDPSKQSFQHLEFTLPNYTLPAPEIEVTPLESTNPFLVRFNVKCTNYDVAPVVNASYAINYVRDFYSVMGDGVTYATLIQMNTSVGRYLSANDIRQMNSPQGLIFTAVSREDAATGLVVMGWNEEARPSNPDAEDSKAYAESRSAVLPDAERVESSLFEELKGDWTANAILHAVRKEYVLDENGKYVKDENGDYKMNETYVQDTIKSKVTIGDITYPEALTEDVYALYAKSKISREETDALFAEFKRLADHNNRKIRGQNRLLCNGLDLDALEISYKGITDYASPWDLFTSPDYSCWTIDDIYYDFGPKWHLQIDQNGNLFIPVNTNRLLPMSNWKSAELLFIGYDKADNMAMMAPQADSGDTSTWPNLPVELSEDKNTMTLKPFIYENAGVEYSFAPTIIIDTKSEYFGKILMSGQIIGEIVLTRGWTEPEPEPAPAMLRRNRQSYTPDLTMTSVKSLGAKVANTQPSVYERTDFTKINTQVK